VQLTAEQIAQIPITERAPEIGQLLGSIREAGADTPGSWDADKVCELLTMWLDGLGYELEDRWWEWTGPRARMERARWAQHARPAPGTTGATQRIRGWGQ
jgi:hypothetical protein